jgi:sarcosine oxidase gamma subunit
MTAPKLDILRRKRDGSFIWMEAAQDMQAAKNRLEELVAVAPGEYFVFDQRSQEIVAKLASRPANASPS